MKRTAMAILTGWMVFCALPAAADMVEVKGRGIMNVDIVSEDEKAYTVKDAEGHKFSVPRNELTMIMKENKAKPPKASKKKTETAKSNASSAAASQPAPAGLGELVSDRLSQANRLEEAIRKADAEYANSDYGKNLNA